MERASTTVAIPATRRRLMYGAAAAYAALHLPFLSASVDDIDSVNFTLALRDFDVTAHQPHPPGYPVYIALGKLSLTAIRAVAPSLDAPRAEVLALAIWSVLGGAVAAVAAAWLFAALHARANSSRSTAVPSGGTALLAAAPLFWVSALRPMSDIPGLAAALMAQALLLHAFSDGRRLPLAAFATGIAAGVRLQCAWLTFPLLALIAFEHRAAGWRWLLSRAAAPFAAGTLAWAVPLVLASGGPGTYARALQGQALDDFTAVDMLWLDPTPRQLLSALHDTFLLPWGWTPLGVAVIAAAIAGAAVMVRHHVKAAIHLAVAFVPYAVLHLLFQDTGTVRYALPLVPAISLLAAYGLATQPATPWLLALIAATALTIAVRAGIEYGAEPHPISRAVADAAAHARGEPPAVVLAHQSIWRVLQVDAGGLPVAEPARRRELLAAGAYWREGGARPVWFLANPERTDLALIDPRTRADVTRYSWGVGRRAALKGARPNAVNWHRFRRPGWFAGEGWALTPETGGVAAATGKGPHHAPIEAYVRRRRGPMHLLVGGWHLGAAGDPPARVQLAIDGTAVDAWTVAADERRFLRFVDVPEGLPRGDGDYATLTIGATAAGGGPAVPVAIRQFDIRPSGRLLWGFGEGWHEAELDPQTGVGWRWTSNRSVLRIKGPSEAVRITLRGESPLRYFDAPPVVRLTAAGRVIAEYRPDDDFEWEVLVPAADLEAAAGAIAIEIDRVYLPDVAEGTADQRQLGLRIYECVVAPAGSGQ